jgi:hypothetical protein
MLEMKTRVAGRSHWPLIAALAAIGGVLFLAYYVTQGPPKDVQPLPRKDAPAPGEKNVKVPVPFEENGKVGWREEPKPRTEKDPVVDAINGFFASGNIAPDARLLKATMDGTNLKLDFHGLFVRGYGTDNEKILLDGILKAVRDNSSAESVEFFEDGRPAQGLGNLELEGPQPVPR